MIVNNRFRPSHSVYNSLHIWGVTTTVVGWQQQWSDAKLKRRPYFEHSQRRWICQCWAWTWISNFKRRGTLHSFLVFSWSNEAVPLSWISHHIQRGVSNQSKATDSKLLIGNSKENLKIHTGVPTPLPSLPSLLYPPLPFFPSLSPFPSLPIPPFLRSRAP